MRLIKASVLARSLGISRYTVRDWCQKQPGLALKKGRDWYIRVNELAKREGLDPVKVLTLTREKWIKAVDLAEKSNIPRRTIAYWCATRPNFGLRIGRIYYINPSELGATQEQIAIMQKWCANRHSLLAFLENTSDLGKT